jgi:ferrous iron transport protein A
MTETTLDTLIIGQQAKIIRIQADKAIKRRMLDMGLVRGEIIKIKSMAPLGDPIEVVIKNYQLSLRKIEAQQITVEVN